MRKTTKLFTSLAMTLALGASLAACSASPEENSKAACDSYAAFVGAVAEVKTSLTSGSTVGDIQSARDKVTTAYTDLQKSLDKVSSDRKGELESAWKDLDKAVSDVDKNLTVPQAKDTLTAPVQKVEEAQTALNKDLTC